MGVKRNFARRVLDALILDRTVYSEVARDPEALGQAAVITAAGGLAQTIGTAGLLSGEAGRVAPGDAITAVLIAFVVWLVTSVAIWLIGVKLMRAVAGLKDVTRAIGFSSAPQLLYLVTAILMATHGSTGAIWATVVTAWALTQAAWFLSAQQALETGPFRTFVIVSLAGLLTALIGLALMPFLPSSMWEGLVL